MHMLVLLPLLLLLMMMVMLDVEYDDDNANDHDGNANNADRVATNCTHAIIATCPHLPLPSPLCQLWRHAPDMLTFKPRCIGQPFTTKTLIP